MMKVRTVTQFQRINLQINPASATSPTPTSSMLIQGATVNQLMSGSSGLSRSPINITEYGEDKILQAILIEQQKTNQILTAQNQILICK